MSARFVTMNMDDGSERPVDLSPDAISAIVAEYHCGSARIGATVHIHGTCFSVTQTRAEILALLAEPAPAPSVEVTEAVAQAATDAYDEEAKTWSWGDRSPMIAAIIAADRARGLRP